MTDEKNQFFRAKENHWKNIEIVQPGEDFLLFDTERERTQIRQTDNGTFGGLKSSIRLETQTFGILNLSISAAPCSSRFLPCTLRASAGSTCRS